MSKVETWDENWERAKGDKCSFCGRESLRLIKGLCSECDYFSSLKQELEQLAQAKHKLSLDELGRLAQLQSELRKGRGRG